MRAAWPRPKQFHDRVATIRRLVSENANCPDDVVNPGRNRSEFRRTGRREWCWHKLRSKRPGGPIAGRHATTSRLGGPGPRRPPTRTRYATATRSWDATNSSNGSSRKFDLDWTGRPQPGTPHPHSTRQEQAKTPGDLTRRDRVRRGGMALGPDMVPRAKRVIGSVESCCLVEEGSRK